MSKRIYKGDEYVVTRMDAMKALKDAGGVRGAAKIIGCSYGTMQKICEHLDIKLPGRGRRRVEIAKSELKRFVKGYSWRQIADHFGCSIGAIRKEFKRHDLAKMDGRNKNADFPCSL